MKRIVAILGLPLMFGAVLAQNQMPAPSQTDASDTSTKTAAKPVFRVGGGVKAPRAIYSPDPDYPKQARKGHRAGPIDIWLIVGSDGQPHDVKVHLGISPEIDQVAVEAVERWKFKPATRDGNPVAVRLNVHFDFQP